MAQGDIIKIMRQDGDGSKLTGLVKNQVGLANVDNTSDSDKPISSDVQDALDNKEPADSTILKDADIGGSIQEYDADTTKNDVNNTFTITQQATITTDDDGSFDMAVTNNFKSTPGSDLTLDFTNLDSGRGGVILFDNSGGYAISKADKIICDSDCLSTISCSGKYVLSYITDGTDVYMTYSKALS